MNYSELLKDPRWQKKRLEIFDRDGWKCVECGEIRTNLHGHHIKYIKNRLPWDYPDHLIITLCENCHKNKHGKDDKKTGGFIHVSGPLKNWMNEIKKTGIVRD